MSRLGRLALAASLVALFVGGQAIACQAQVLMPGRSNAAANDGEGRRLVLPESSDLNRVLRKVTEFFAQDPPKWDDGARMMQDLLEGKVFDAKLADEQMLNPFYSVYSQDQRLFVPFARYCQDLLCDLPPEGLSAYRFLTDSRAEDAFLDARERMDSAALDRIAQLYYASEPGPRIVALLADLAELEGQLSRAIFLRDRLLETYPDLSEEQRLELLVRQLHTVAMLGMGDRHAKLVEALSAYGAGRSVRVAGENVQVAALAEHPAFVLRDPRGAERIGESVATGFAATSVHLLWRRDFATPDPYFLRTPTTSRNNYIFMQGGGARVVPHQKQHRPGAGVFTWVDEDGIELLAYKDHDALQVVETLSGKIRGEDGGNPRVRKPQNQQLRVRMPLTDVELQSVTSDGRFLYITTGNKPPVRTNMRGGASFPYRNEIRAFDLESGKTAWTSKLPKKVGKRLFFRGPPVRFREWLFAPVRQNASFAIARLDAATGEVQKVVTVHEGGTEFLRVPGMPPVVVDTRLLYMSNAGAIASLSLPDLELRWLRAYEQRSPEEVKRKRKSGARTARRAYQVQPKKIAAWRPRPLIVRDGLVLVAASDSDALVALDINSGEPAWFLPRRSSDRSVDFDELIGVDGAGVVFLAGKQTLQAVDISSGKRLYEKDLSTLPKGPIRGWSTLAGGAIWSPFEGGAYRFRCEDGELDGVVEYPATELGMPDWSQLPQRLQFAGTVLLSICESGITAYGSPEAIALAPRSSYERARALAATGQLREAFDVLLGSLAPTSGLARAERMRARDFAVRLAGELSRSTYAETPPESASQAALAILDLCDKAVREAGLPLDPRVLLYRIECMDPSRHAAQIRALRNAIASLSEAELGQLAIDGEAGAERGDKR